MRRWETVQTVIYLQTSHSVGKSCKKVSFYNILSNLLFCFFKTQLKRVKMWQKCFDAGWQPFFKWHPCHPNRDKCKIRVTGVSITKICPSHFDGFFKSEMKTKLWNDQKNIETWHGHPNSDKCKIRVTGFSIINQLPSPFRNSFQIWWQNEI